MELDKGVTFGSFEIVAPLGAGGMGEVYRARDLRLQREVAIKVLPKGFADDPERVARLTREARLLASLSHPNIASIFGIEERGREIALILELVEGATLADQLSAGPIPLKSAVAIAHQIAEAMEAAHARGIIHRDLKPANLKITPDGRVKVLDFGIAKVLADGAADVEATPSPASATRSGVIIGTPGYMSPEQATGATVDRRADVWAFGCVLFEMLSGSRPFAGATASETLVRVLEREPDWTTLPRDVPPPLVRLLERCLRKDPRQRLQDIGDARVELDDLRTGSHAPLSSSLRQRLAPRRHVWLWLSIAAIAALGIGGLGWTLLRRPASPVQLPLQLAVLLPPGVALQTATDHPALALSPDGRHLVFVGEEHGLTRLYRRTLAEKDAQRIPGTEGAAAPFFSPDGAWVGFFDGSMLKKVALAGGLPVALMGVTNVGVNQGAAWITPDSIVLAPSPNSGLAVAAIPTGRVGAPADWKTISVDSAGPYAWPYALTGTPYVAFAENVGDSPDKARLSLFDRRTHSIKPVLVGGTNPLYSPTGHLLFVRGGALFAAQLDLEHGSTGPEYRVLDSVIMEPSGAAHVALSRSGTLAYVTGPVVSRERELVWVDRGGAATTLLANGRNFSWPRLSPDRTRLSLTSSIGANSDVYVLAMNRLALDRVTTHPGEDFGAVWNPDGTRLAFSSEMFFAEEGPHAAWQVGSEGRIELLVRTPGTHVNWDFPTSWSSDGNWIAYTRERNGNADVEVVSAKEPRTSRTVAGNANAQEFGAAFSPNAQFIAYVSDVSGEEEVYVQPFPGPGRRVRISTEGGTEPVWNPNGRELFYRRHNDVLSVRFENDVPIAPRTPTVLFSEHFEPAPYGGRQANYDVWPDGTRFIFVRRKDVPRPTVIHVVVNWPAVLGTQSARH